jgi:A/G-specific adenine glycosylase
MNSDSTKRLSAWFLTHQRQLPWREDPSPYAVWVSEIMLQQTRVSVVIPYFLRWMEKFPTIQDLAKAPIEDVLKEWEGLGYYSRARNLHGGAQYVAENFGGNLPETYEELIKIKGLGSYTVGAILSFAFKQKAAAVDGNVLRVLSRYFCIEDDIGKPETQKSIRKLAQDFLPEKKPWIVSEALIELGATICGKKPRCFECPLKAGCRGYLKGIAEQLPIKSKKEKTTLLYRGVAVVECQGHLLLRKGEPGRVMADLYEFPYFEISSTTFGLDACKRKILGIWGVKAKPKKILDIVQHTFTRYKATLIPHHMVVESMFEAAGHQWVCVKDIGKLPFSSGHKKILTQFENL